MAARKTTTNASVPAALPPVGRAGTPAQGRELRARGKRTMRNLLDAGIDVFAKRGFHAARVDDIVKAARTSHGTFYLYFANKEDLFQALVADVAEQMAGLAGSLGPITPDEAGREELERWLARFTDLYEHYGPVLRTWTDADRGDREAGRMGADLLGDLAGSLTARITPDTTGDLDPAIASLALVAMVERCNYFVHSGRVRVDRDTMVATLATITHRSLFGTG